MRICSSRGDVDCLRLFGSETDASTTVEREFHVAVIL